jgi:hypothetical protein
MPSGEPITRSFVENKSLLVNFSITILLLKYFFLCFLLFPLVTSLQCLEIGPNFVITPHKYRLVQRDPFVFTEKPDVAC